MRVINFGSHHISRKCISGGKTGRCKLENFFNHKKMHVDWIKKEWISSSINVTQFKGSIWKSCLFIFIRHLDRKKKRCLCSMEAKATGVVALPEQKPWKKYSLVYVHCSVNYSVDTRTSGSKSQHMIKSAELQTLWSGSWHSLAIQLEEWSLRYSSLPCRSD